jgi:DNA-binding NarL/FixJ family response regulator
VGQCISVIVVDGQDTVAESLAAALSTEPDMRVVGVASDASSAAALVERTGAEVLVMDYRLSNGDGIKAAGLIRRLNPNLNIVLLASIADEWVLARALSAGCTGVLSKDSTLDKLPRVVRSAAHGERVVEGEFAGRVELLRGSSNSRRSILTTREQEVLRAISLGQTTAMMARSLGLSEYTVRNHVRNILGKLNAHTKLEAVVNAARAGLLRFDD